MRDAKRLIEQVRAAADNHPDRIYSLAEGSSSCAYKPDESNPAGCIIGAAARALGVDVLDSLPYGPPPFAQEEPSKTQGTGIGTIIRDKAAFADAAGTEADWLREVQRVQDNGGTWSEAVANADVAFPQPDEEDQS